MNLSKICINPALRNGWQAIDLGFLLALRWYKPLFVSWLVPSLLVFLVFSVIFYDHSWAAVLAVWWLKPLWDRLPLSIASRALFSEPLDVRNTLKRSFTLFKRDWLWWLTWRRLNPVRSFDMPVTLLEGLSGATRTRRLTVLHQTSSNAALWLTLLCLGAELSLYYAMTLVVVLLIPEEMQLQWAQGIADGEFLYYIYLDSVLLYVAMILIAPLYTVAGFIIYIARRIELEGWDIEIRFRHLIDQVSQKESFIQKSKNKSAIKSPAITVLVPMLLVFGLTFGSESQSQPSEEPEFVQDYYENLQKSQTAQDAKQEIVEVLSGENFHRVETDSGWRKIEVEEEEIPEDDNAFFRFLDRLYDFTAPIRRLFSGIASGFEILVWVLIAVVIGVVIYLFRDALAAMGGYSKLKTADEEKPKVLFGLDVRKESIPGDVPQQVAQLWREGKHREAIGLLYRATLSKLIYQFSYEFYDGYTEQECVVTVTAGGNSPVSDYMVRLTRAWQFLAYAHQLPEVGEVNSLCDEWPRLFMPQKFSERPAQSNSSAPPSSGGVST